ncbi:hypothetical protein M426DRAFT_320170 [Hypoxylon sp. CI-4A]|nr:hypothetical protein M426DRAFT_320170 [Hypoxylon sp. CI-4A]
MEPLSPPKRMTRARAAAKDATSTTKSTTAGATGATKSSAAKAVIKTASATSTTTTRTTKRKTRSDDNEDEEPQTGAEQSTTSRPIRARGRPKKVAEPEPNPEPEPEATEDAAPTTRATRGRAKKVATTTASEPTSASTAAPKSEPAKTRASTRTRKTTTEDTKDEAPAEPVKKTTRSRATTKKTTTGTVTTTVSTEPTPGLKSAVSRPASRLEGTTKKTVTFREPEKEKENILPPAKAAKTKSKAAASEPATGMRAKPVRKPAAGGRTTRASAKTATTSEKRDKSPLSPKKDAENRPLSKDVESDDELATLEKTPLKPLMKSPVKPPAAAKIPDLQPHTKDADENVQEAPEATGSLNVFGSPARRPPSSPFKDIMRTPAKKVEAIPSLLFSAKNDEEAAQLPAKTSMLQSPAKRPQLPFKTLQPPSQESGDASRSPAKASLLQSPAKRPASPFKFRVPTSLSFGDSAANLFAPKTSPVEEKPMVEEAQESSEDTDEMEVEAEDEPVQTEETAKNQAVFESPSQLTFPGRLSAVLPRHADPALKKNPLPAIAPRVEQSEPTAVEPAEPQEEQTAETESNAANDELNDEADDPMDVDEADEVNEVTVEAKEEESAPSRASITPPQSHPKPAVKSLSTQLLEDGLSDSEDELASSGMTPNKYKDDTTVTFSGVPSTPTPSIFKTPRGAMPSSAIKAASRAIRSISKGTRLGFTPLAAPHSERKAMSPTKPVSILATSPELSLLKENDGAANDGTPSKGFFDDEMRIRAEMEIQAAMEAALEAEIDAKFDIDYRESDFDRFLATSEDVELAAGTNEMSLMETDEAEETKENHGHDDSISEASQEYGDENAVPIDPALFGTSNEPRLEPVTPTRPSAPRPFHTVSKVPLKPADDSTPRIKKRSASVSKASSANRPTGLFRNATVISYTPTKDPSAMDIDGEEEESQYPPVTPSKADIWSSMGTPARTPRRDLNKALLRGAVVFVDVHTSDGADASTIFVELLTQMGARCVKSWPWNPSYEEGSTSRIGITHVVFKDGGKRTLEKVRESNGVVQCVGVGWVLDCERENEWLDEAPYYIDTSLVPRGGRNRRKSMEPKALANHNGTLVTPMKNTGGAPRECQTVPNNHISRRDSTAWMRTPSDHDEDEDAPGESDWDHDLSMLTPVPKTPAPQDVRRFALDVMPDTPSTEDGDENSPERAELMMRTCPPKKTYADLGHGTLKQEKDQGILMRLMAARRKSLQFAPKIASPLSKAWN